MPQPITILGALLCFVVLYLKYKAAPKESRRRTPQQKFDFIKLLAAALLAWLAISLQLRKLDHSLTSASPYEMSLWDRIVHALTK